MTLVPNWLRQRALVTPNRIALIADGEQLTFAAMDRRVDTLAATLHVPPGARVGLLMRNSVRYVELVHALMRVGAVLVPLNTRLSEAEWQWQAEDAGIARLIREGDDLSNATAA